MISYLKGTILDVEADTMTLFNQGVGYQVFSNTSFLMEALPGESAELWIYTHVREDQITLFGFTSKAEKQLFLSLIKVNGIGPKVAMKILSAAPISHILQMIDAGDAAGLSKLPKVGKKTAETIILELKGKLVSIDSESQQRAFAARSEIISALVNLGFKSGDVEKVVGKMDGTTDLQEGVRLGLKMLTSEEGA